MVDKESTKKVDFRRGEGDTTWGVRRVLRCAGGCIAFAMEVVPRIDDLLVLQSSIHVSLSFSVEAAEGEAAAEGDAGLPQVVDEEEAEVARLEALLCDRDVSWPETSVLCDTEVRETLSGMLRFHRREAKPQWWRRYEWIARPPAELVADPRTL
eukprot:jgi/Chrpa1/20012/Chrysochromulina_OHIO_Genome00003836-RA